MHPAGGGRGRRARATRSLLGRATRPRRRPGGAAQASSQQEMRRRRGVIGWIGQSPRVVAQQRGAGLWGGGGWRRGTVTAAQQAGAEGALEARSRRTREPVRVAVSIPPRAGKRPREKKKSCRPLSPCLPLPAYRPGTQAPAAIHTEWSGLHAAPTLDYTLPARSPHYPQRVVRTAGPDYTLPAGYMPTIVPRRGRAPAAPARPPRPAPRPGPAARPAPPSARSACVGASRPSASPHRGNRSGPSRPTPPAV